MGSSGINADPHRAGKENPSAQPHRAGKENPPSQSQHPLMTPGLPGKEHPQSHHPLMMSGLPAKKQKPKTRSRSRSETGSARSGLAKKILETGFLDQFAVSISR